MKHIKIIITLGILVAVVPFLGIPHSWKKVLYVGLGVVIAVIAFRFLAAARAPKEEIAVEEPVQDEHIEEVPEEYDEK